MDESSYVYYIDKTLTDETMWFKKTIGQLRKGRLVPWK